MLNFNEFSTTRPILDLRISLDRARQYLKLYLMEQLPGVTFRTLETLFMSKFMLFKFSLILILDTECIIYEYFTFRRTHWGQPGLKNQ